MLILIIVFVVLVGAAIWLHFDDMNTIAMLILIISVICFVLLGAWAIIENVNPEASYASQAAKREALVELYESGLYKNDNNYGAVELYEEIGKWNGALMAGKAARRSPWTNVFYGSYVDRLDPIELK